MRNFVERDLPRLLELLYDAALDPGRWQAFLDALPACFGGANGVLHLYDTAKRTVTFFASFGSDPTFTASYAAHFARVNPYPRHGFERISVGTPMYATNFLEAEQAEATEFFNDWMRPQGVTSDHLGVVFGNDGSNVALLSIAPNASVYRGRQERYMEQLRLLTPHLMRAHAINRTIAARRATEVVANAALEALGMPAFVLARSRRVIAANALAEALLRSDDVVSIRPGGELRASEPAADRALSAAATLALGEGVKAIAGPLRFTSRHDGRTHLAWVLPVFWRRTDPDTAPVLFSEGLSNGPVLLLLVSPDRSAEIPASVIAAAFQLSPAEAQLAAALTAGEAPEAYARRTRHSRNTVRNQLASVFAKTGTCRQGELVARIVGALGAAPQPGRRQGQ